MWRFLLLAALAGLPIDARAQGEGKFVEKLGEELWQLSQLVTKLSEITAKYKSLNARVDTNDGRNLTGQIVDNVQRLLRRREKAVRCVQSTAEDLLQDWERDQLYDNFTLEYYNMQYSGLSELKWDLNENTTYLVMNLKEDKHFYGIPVNITHSAVHVPTNLYDRYPFVAEAIKWTSDLDEVFIRNYRSDPGLSWQYFGGSTGIMRHFPAMKWLSEGEAELYDCRTRPWFLEAATCAKDVVILVDNSGSMTGMRSTIAKLVVTKLLSTLGNNDYVNVYNFSWTASPVLPCFNSLVQANVDNIKDLQEAVAGLKPLGNASVPNAFETAFKLLEQARIERGCDNFTDCQQIIMLVTDGLPGNITQVFERYNRLPDGTVPIRVFTYLLGLEVRGVNEIQDIACQNRGYYTHMTGLDQVQDAVLKYLSVMARPLALQKEYHPLRWTHLFADVDDKRLTAWLRTKMEDIDDEFVNSPYFSQQRRDLKYIKTMGEDREMKEERFRLMTSVAIPVYDTRELIVNQTKFPELLAGVAGTDVHIDDIYKLTYPYKIGANGYAFIVTNNGHIVMHPDHRPVSNGTLKWNYNSVDLLDVEFVKNEEDEESLNTVREFMVNQLLGDAQDIMVKFHYDDFHRIGVEKRDYYVAPLEGTPFSLGLAIPSDYGDYQIAVKDMVNERFLMTTHDPLVAFFRDPEFRIHPDWFYCKYKYPSYKFFNSSEEELLDILRKIPNQVIWKKYLEEWMNEQYSSNDDIDNCNAREVPFDEFHCDPELIILLIFDASVTNDSFRDPIVPRNDYDKRLLEAYNATLRFVGTQSGLTRWQRIPKPDPSETDRGDFGLHFPRTIEESWFKAAVLQFNLDTGGESNKSADSFVFSVPFDAGNADDIYITGSMALFPRDGGRKAPASVVGYQFTYDSFDHHIRHIAKDCNISCWTEELDCYIIDHNAYIVHSDVRDIVGKPFSSFEPAAMSRLVEIELFEEITITDFQALVTEEHGDGSSASELFDKPWSLAIKVLSWFWTHVIWMMFQQISVSVHSFPTLDIEDDDDDDDDVDYADRVAEKAVKSITTPTAPVLENRTYSSPLPEPPQMFPAFVTHTRYLLNQNRPQWHLRQDTEQDSSLVSVRRIQHTNLLLVVIDNLVLGNSTVSALPLKKTTITDACERYAHNGNFTKRRLPGCISYHPEEEELDACGSAISLQMQGHSHMLILIFVTITYFLLLK